MRNIFYSLLFTFLLASPVWGATYWVAPSGSDSNSCSSISGSSDPGRYRKTITAGIDCLRGGDTLMAKDGVYTESITKEPPSGTSSAKTTIKAVNSRKAIIRPSNGRAIWWADEPSDSRFSNVRVEGFVLDSTAGGSMPMRMGRRFKVSNLEIVDNEFIGSTSYCFSLGNPNDPMDGTLIQRNLFHHCPKSAIYNGASSNGIIELNKIHTVATESGWAIKLYNGNAGSVNNTNVVRYNEIWNSGTTAIRTGCIQVSDGANNLVYRNICRNNVGQFGIGTWNQVKGLKIYHNTVYKNLGVGIDIRDASTSDVIVKNNIVLDSSGGQIKIGPSDTVSSHNLTSGKATDIFTNPSGGDLTLRAGSPAIDKGFVVSGFLFNGAAPDQGAYETVVETAKKPSPPSNLKALH